MLHHINNKSFTYLKHSYFSLTNQILIQEQTIEENLKLYFDKSL